MILSVGGGGNRKQRRDRPALDDLEVIVNQTPFDVLRAAEVRFDAAAEFREAQDLRIGQRGLLLLLRIDRLLVRPACLRGINRKLLGAECLRDDARVGGALQQHSAGTAQADDGIRRT